MWRAVNNLNELDDKAYDMMKDQEASNAWDELQEYTDNLVEMSPADRLQAIIDQPNLVSQAIDVLAWRAGMNHGIVPCSLTKPYGVAK